jgi:hypothetical protein
MFITHHIKKIKNLLEKTVSFPHSKNGSSTNLCLGYCWLELQSATAQRLNL